MAFLILIAFVTVPLIEIAVFIEVGGRIGLWPTIGIVILTAVVGTAMLRQQGISVLFRIRENLEANRLPVREMFDGVCLVLAGALLLTPGFVTDGMGLLLMVPPIRSALAAEIARRFLANAEVRVLGRPADRGPAGDGPVIDGDFRDVTPEEDAAARRDGRLPPGDDGAGRGGERR